MSSVVLLCLLAPAAEPSFVNDVVPLLTRFGCNQGACHGKGAGQNGFRLSLRGYAPEMDHAWLTREFADRRIDPANPESSTILRKATGQAPHEGGKLFAKDSRAAKLLADWIRAGSPGPKKDDPSLVSLKMAPAAFVAAPGKTQALKVEATFTDGVTRDVTWLAKFDSSDAGTAEVDAHGTVKVRRHGETSVRAMFMTEVAVSLVTAPHERQIDPAKFAAKHNAVDTHVFARLAALRIEPSDLCTDAEFVRRAFLDTIGVLPTPDEVKAFVADPKADKRDRLIDALLERPEFVDYWTLFLGDLLQNRRERDHDVRGVKGVKAFHAWIRKQVQDNRPWDKIARDVLTASGTSEASPAVGYFVVTVGEHGDPVKSEVADSVAQALLGTRIGCARCHNHPLERYTQDDFYHFAAFFAKVKLDRVEAKKGPTTLRMAGTGGKEPHMSKQKPAAFQPRTHKMLPPRPLDRSDVGEFTPEGDARQKLADWVTSSKNEMFAGAMVNRLWKHFMAVGLVEPVDDLRASNPPSNPALFKALSEEFVRSKFDLKAVMRRILRSRTYQLSSATTPGNATDAKFYSHYYARRLPAEALLDAISSATGVPDRFAGFPVGTRATQLPDPGMKSYFLELFGRSDRVTACACERNGEVTMPQLLHLRNGEGVAAKIRSGEGRLAALIAAKKTDDEVIDALFLATLGRLPKEAQRTAVKASLADGEGREEVFRDLFWALLNSKEFSFNH